MRISWLTIFLDFPAASFQAGTAFWREVTGSGLSAARGAAGEFATLAPAAGDACLRVQRVRDGDGGCHLDLHVDTGVTALAEATAAARALGATLRDQGEDLVTGTSPGGFSFCLVPWRGESAVPAPARSGDGDGDGEAGTSRADQLCLDIPPGAFGAECDFWAALTTWDLHAGSWPEFAYLERPLGIGVRLLLQRRDEAEPGDPVTGHIDFACSDADALARRHAESGARILAEFPGWIAMADPLGRPYCLTRRDPVTGRRPAQPAT